MYQETPLISIIRPGQSSSPIDSVPVSVMKRARCEDNAVRSTLEVGGANPLNLHLGLVADNAPRARQRKWGEKEITADTVKLAKELLTTGVTSTSAELSLHKAFTRWKNVNIVNSTPIGQILAIFAAYLLEAKLKASSVVTYIRQLITLCRRERTEHAEPQWYVVHDLLRGLNLKAAKEDRNHAPDISRVHASKILSTIKATDVGFTIWAMCNCGARVEDLLNLGLNSFIVSEKVIHIHFQITKTRRDPSEQYSIDLPIWLPLPYRLRPHLREKRLFTCNVNRVNRILHEAGFTETSYSFRRLFINDVIDRFTENGITNWLRVIELTGHEQVKTVKGLYKDHSKARCTPSITIVRS